MVQIKNGDFIEVDYTGRVKDSNQIFDLTNKEEAKKNNLFDEQREYNPIIICVGEKNLIKGVDDQLVGKEISKEYDLTIKPENGFGIRNPKLMKLVNANIFKKSNIMPVPGLQINIDGMLGTIRSFSGGRVIVDFNHPLADKELVYKIKILRKVTDAKEKLNACMKFMSLKDDMFSIDLKENKAKIHLKANLDPNLRELLKKKIQSLVPEIKNLEIEVDTKTHTK